MANTITVLRIALSVALLMLPALSPVFLCVYAIAGATDMLDGFVARRMGMENELGARLDSIADLTLSIVCLAKVLPEVSVPLWLWIWVVMIAAVKTVNLTSVLVTEKRLAMPHTMANKIAGFAVFIVPFAIPSFGVRAVAIPACAVATFAAVQEGHLIKTANTVRINKEENE